MVTTGLSHITLAAALVAQYLRGLWNSIYP
jgi:hypothetical protein